MRLWGAFFSSVLAVHCATSEDDPDRKKPGGVVDGGSDAGGSAGTGGSGGSGGGGGSAGADAGDANDAEADADAAPDAVPDAPGDAPAEADAPGDAGPLGRVLLVARSSAEVTFAERTTGSWAITNVTRATVSAPAIATFDAGAIAVVRDQSGNALSWSAYDASTSSWSSFAPVATAGATLGTPALATTSTNVQLAFLGTDNKLYANVYTPGSGWMAGFQNVQAGSVHSFGPSAPALAASGNAVTLAQEGNDGDLYTQVWQTVWQAAHAHGLSPKLQADTPPSAATRPGGKVLVSWVETTTQRLMWSEGWGTAWSAPQHVHAAAHSASTPALATLENGDLVLAYRALDDKVHATVLSGGSFAAPAPVHPSLTTTTSPAVTAGVGGELAVVAWVSGGSIQASSLGTGGWSGPTAVAASGHQAVALSTWSP